MSKNCPLLDTYGEKACCACPFPSVTDCVLNKSGKISSLDLELLLLARVKLRDKAWSPEKEEWVARE